MTGEKIIDVHRSDSSVSKAHDSFHENIEQKDEVGGDSAAVGGEQTQVSETPTLWMWVLTFVSGISGLLFGYDTGVISGALVVIGGDLGPAELSSQQKEFITAATSLGALIFSVFSGALADHIGRKWVIAIADVVFITGAIIQALSKSLWIMVAGRFIIGWGVGLASLIVPLYLAELSPAHYRGRMILINVLFITFGQVVAYAIGAGLTHVESGWR
ncbi:and other transporter-domain-containing protein [Tuber borchii]|uniref:And other transporter-domain-containing protein n=1 Tax=Tuber borchii TaxID=42251 RepID=A0A2T6ZL85_TUBBO|nr:and other transporter-domain-containing protein [Tuber borchii]